MTFPMKTTKLLFPICRHSTVRFLSVSNSWNDKVKMIIESNRMVRIMNKLMSGTKRSIRKPDHSHPAKHLTDFGFATGTSGKVHHKPVSGRLLRRTEMLNNLFIEQISSLLATGEVSPEFLGLGIQISKVKVTADFSGVMVYWYASGTEKDEEIEKLLDKSAGHLRHLLSQLRVIGVVPPIKFYKDKTFSKVQEVEMLLRKCQIPPGFISEAANDASTPELVTNPSQKRDKIFDDEDEMTHDILGVKHDLIMNEIRKSLQKMSERVKAREENQKYASLSVESQDTKEAEADLSNNSTSGLEFAVTDHRKRQAEFLKYLKKQKAEKTKQLKMNSVEAKESEFYREVKEERTKNQLLNRLDEMDDFSEDLSDDFLSDKYHEDEEAYYNNLRESFK